MIQSDSTLCVDWGRKEEDRPRVWEASGKLTACREREGEGQEAELGRHWTLILPFTGPWSFVSMGT